MRTSSERGLHREGRGGERRGGEGRGGEGTGLDKVCQVMKSNREEYLPHLVNTHSIL